MSDTSQVSMNTGGVGVDKNFQVVHFSKWSMNTGGVGVVVVHEHRGCSF